MNFLLSVMVGMVVLVPSTLSQEEEPIVLLPQKDGVEAALLVVNGAYINGAAYEPLGELFFMGFSSKENIYS